MAYGKYKMVMNPKGAEEARRKQEIATKEKRIPSKPKKKQPIVKFGKAKPEKRPLPQGGDKKGPGRRTIRPPKAGDRRMRGGR